MIYISHCSQDFSFVRFLTHILNIYKIQTWGSQLNTEKNDFQTKEFENLLTNSEKLLVVVSSFSLKSSSQSHEVHAFQKLKPSAMVIPLILEHVNLNKISPGLAKYHFIDFSRDVTTNFKLLLEKLGREFMPSAERRKGSDRRHGNDRRCRADRRGKDVFRRLQKSFWKRYSEARCIRKDDEIDLTAPEVFLLLSAIKPEAKKYLCFDEHGALYNMDHVISATLYHVWSLFSEEQNKNLINARDLTDALAQKILSRYMVQSRDRRGNDRRSGKERRKADGVSQFNRQPAC